LELSSGSGGCGSGGASSCRHVRPSRRRLRNHDAIGNTGGAASTTRRRREIPHSITPSIPRCQGGWRQLEYTRVTISPPAPSADGGSARRGPTARARTGFDLSQSRGHIIRGWRTGQDTPGPSRASEPVRPSTIQGSNSLVHPMGWRAGEIHPGTHAASVPARPCTIPTSHEAHLGRQAGVRTWAFKLPRHRPATPGPPPIILGTAGRQVRPSGDTGPTTAHPIGPPQSSRKGKGLSDPAERAGSDSASLSRSDHCMRAQQKKARHGLHRNR